MGRSSTIYVKDSIRWYPGKSVPIENTWVRATQNCIGSARHGDSSEGIDAPLSKIEDHGGEECKSDTLIPKFWRPAMGRLKQEQWSRIEREWMALKEEKVPVTSGKKKASVRKKTNAVSGMRVTIVHKNQTTMPPRLLSHPCHEVEVCRRKEVSSEKVTMVPFSDNRADIIWKVLARDRLVNIGILPSVNSTKQKRVAKPGISVWSRIMRLMNNQTKCPKKGCYLRKEEKATTRMLWLLWKIVPQFGCVSQDSEALVFSKRKKVSGNPMRKV